MGAIAAVFVVRRREMPRVGQRDPESLLPALFRNLASVRAVGQHYLDRVPYDPSRDSLGCPFASGAGALSLEELRARIAGLSRDDFEAGRVVCVGGWLLSVTEARVCAIVTLSQPDRV